MSTQCTPQQAARLSRAINLPTITPLPDAPADDAGYRAFDELVELLRTQFPHAASTLRWERLGPLALLIHWQGTGNEPPLALYAHGDVVPAGDESSWGRPPFSGEIADGAVWGRGTLDDKGSLLSVMEAVEELLAHGYVPRRTVLVAVGGDEELSGSRGAGVIAAALRERGMRLFCLVDEGSVIADGVVSIVKKPLALIGMAEKGFANVRISVTGTQGHSAMPGAGTAAGALAAALAALERAPFPPRLTSTVRRFFAAMAPHASPALGLAFRLIRPLWPVLRRVLAADASTDALIRTTQAVTMLQGSERPNVIPGEAAAVVNLRILPGESTHGALLRIQDIAARHVPKRFALRVEILPGSEASEPVPELLVNAALWDALATTVTEIAPDAVPVPFLVVMATDSRRFSGLADSIVRFMPAVLTQSDVALIHGVNEHITLENYGRMIAFYRAFIPRVTGAAQG